MREMRARGLSTRVVGATLATVIMVLLQGAVTTPAAFGCTGNNGVAPPNHNLKTIIWGNSPTTGGKVQFDNFDFGSECATASNAQWPIDLIFENDANTNKIANNLSGVCAPSFGSGILPCGEIVNSTEYATVNNGNGYGFEWSSSAGYKNGTGGARLTTIHMRMYATHNYLSYSTLHGYFVIASLHHDYGECPVLCSPTFGRSEGAERWMAYQINKYQPSDGTSWHARYDYYQMYNYEPFTVDGDHIWSNDGYATEVAVCPYVTRTCPV
jgi:hypothetical protein